MDMTGIIIAIAAVGGTGLIISVFLSIFGNIFKVEIDNREQAIINELPGNNCGGCGYAGCSGLAAAIVGGKALVNACPVGGQDAVDKISLIMGVDSLDSVRKVASVKCAGTCQNTGNFYDYSGINDCLMASGVPGGGPKTCDYGCLGFGSCKDACSFGAISIIDGIAVVNKAKCVACGKCIAKCPKKLIELIPYDAAYTVKCGNKDKGPEVMKVCATGCIGCGICARNCSEGAVTISDNVAHINQERCIGCGICQEKCPKKVICNA